MNLKMDSDEIKDLVIDTMVDNIELEIEKRDGS